MKRMAQVNVVLVVSAPARKKSSQMLTSWSTQNDELVLEFFLKIPYILAYLTLHRLRPFVVYVGQAEDPYLISAK